MLSISSSDSATKNPTSFRDAPECSACSKGAPLGLNETEAAALTALHHPQASPVSLAPSLLSASHRKCGNDSRKKGQSCLFFVPSFVFGLFFSIFVLAIAFTLSDERPMSKASPIG